MKKFTFLLSFTLLVLVYSTSYAQPLGTSTRTATVAVSIAEVLDLSVSGGTVLFDFNSIEKLDAGITQENAVSLTYKSNKPWFINIKANTESFAGGVAGNLMPASVLQYKLNGVGTFTPLTVENALLPVLENKRGTATLGVDYKLNPGYLYAPATDYALVVTYTITNE